MPNAAHIHAPFSITRHAAGAFAHGCWTYAACRRCCQRFRAGCEDHYQTSKEHQAMGRAREAERGARGAAADVAGRADAGVVGQRKGRVAGLAHVRVLARRAVGDGAWVAALLQVLGPQLHAQRHALAPRGRAAVRRGLQLPPQACFSIRTRRLMPLLVNQGVSEPWGPQLHAQRRCSDNPLDHAVWKTPHSRLPCYSAARIGTPAFPGKTREVVRCQYLLAAVHLLLAAGVWGQTRNHCQARGPLGPTRSR